MSGFIDTITNLGSTVMGWIETAAASILSVILGLLGRFLQVILSVLPTSPIRGIIDSIDMSGMETGLGWLNWFVDVSWMLEVFSLWLTAYAVYLVFSVIMRWVKLIK